MNSHEILRADMIDILFDNRNKQYGAYTLRKYYNQRLGMALGVSLSCVLLLFVLIKPASEKGPAVNEKPDVIVQAANIPPAVKPPEVPKMKPAPPAQKTAQIALVRPQIIEDIKVKNPMVDQKTLSEAVIASKTIEGPALRSDPVLVVPTYDGKGEVDKKPDATNTSVTESVQKEPEFPGGTKAWLDFLNNNLRVPDELQAGEKKMVLIRFQVAIDGRVTGFEVAQSGGNLYDNEVIRVLKRMPKWKPAIQNGQPVARSFTQPVTFMGLE